MAEADSTPLECLICTELYDYADHEPKFLACHHTLCLTCICQLAVGSIVKCPYKCKEVTVLPNLSPQEQTRGTVNERLFTRVKKLRRNFYININQKKPICRQEHINQPEPNSSVTPPTTPTIHHPTTNIPATTVFSKKIYSKGTPLFSYSKYIAVNNEGMIYAPDQFTMLKLNSEGSFVSNIFPVTKIAIDRKRKELVCIRKKVFDHQSTNTLVVYSFKGEFKRKIRIAGMRCINGVAVNSYDQIICSDALENNICVVNFSSSSRNILFHKETFTATVAYRFGREGSAPGEFKLPGAICIGKYDDIVAVDGQNHRIQIFDYQGQFLGQFGRMGNRNGQFLSPVDVAVDQLLQILVSDSDRNDIQVFSYTGEFIRCINGMDDMICPRGLAVTPDQCVMVADCGSDCIYKLQYM